MKHFFAPGLTIMSWNTILPFAREEQLLCESKCLQCGETK